MDITLQQRGSHPSREQIDVLLEYLEKNTNLVKGFPRLGSAREVSKIQWENLALRLNALNGCCKSCKQWIKTVFVVYIEKGLNTEPNKKSNWIDLFNDSISLPFEERLSKSKLNFDRTTIKLLPLLIKALKQNRLLHKTIEDYSNSSPAYERKTTKQFVFKRNLFPDSKNFIKKPISRLYTIEYKTSPVVYYKKPSTNSAYFTKVRKIRDYKRIMEYVDKMISEKITDHTQPMFIDNYSAETKKLAKQIVNPTEPTNANFIQHVNNLSKMTATKPKSDITGCKCPNLQVSVLLNKIISTIQQVLPDGRSMSSTEKNNCSTVTTERNELYTTKSIKSPINTKTTLPFRLSEFSNIFQQQDTKTFENITQKGNSFSRSGKLDFGYSFDSKTEFKEKVDKHNNFTVTTVTQYIGRTDFNETLTSTQPMMPATKPAGMENFGTTIRTEKYLSQYIQEEVKLNNNHAHIFNSALESDLQVESSTTSYKSTIAEEISNLGITSLELFKSKVFPSNRRFNIIKNSTSPFSLLMKNNISYNNNLEENTNDSYTRYDAPIKKETVSSLPPVLAEDNDFEFLSNDSSNIYNQKQVHTASNRKTDLKSIINHIQSKLNAGKKEHRYNHNLNSAKIEEDEVDTATHDDDENEEYHVKPTESMFSLSLLSLSNNTLVSKDLTKRKSKEDIWDFLKTNYDRSKLYSMIPMSRPNYLEIHRNGWRADENEDYDLNMKHNVILLIYEYAIAIESSLVQIRRKGARKAGDNLTNDKPVADRLDRSYFGFDQDYYERMPLLVNAMQENNYVDPTGDANVDNKEPATRSKKPKAIPMTNKTNNIHFKPSPYRRTSPRPFIFEYKSPTPVPFSKTYGSKSWIESYRNAQRLQNIQQVIKYLEKTINAKIGDMYAEPTSKHIAFTGVYMEPSMNDKLSGSDTSQVNLKILNNNSERMDSFKSNHKSDPLFKYKPSSPGDVNLLADSFLRFSPTLFEKYDHNIPMFKPIPDRKKHCNGYSCENIDHNLNSAYTSISETQVPEPSSFSKAKSFSVMLNLFQLNTSTERITKSHDKLRPSPTDKIYITTSKPLIFFKSKSRSPNKRRTIPAKRPRVYNDAKLLLHKSDYESETSKKNHSLLPGSSMIVQINLYTPEKKNEITTNSAIFVDSIKGSPSSTEANNFVPISPYTTDIPINLSTTQVEDFHVGSSGIIPIEARTLPPPPSTMSTLRPSFDITVSSTEGAWLTKPPDILKFSHEDAKISEEYVHRQYREFDYSESLNKNRRNFRDHFDDDDIESHTVNSKLNNVNISSIFERETKEDNSGEVETTTVTTTTQINGHYRSRNRKILSTLLDPNSEINKKRRLSLLAKGFRRPDFSLSYTEIKRNRTEFADDQ
ncbi:hypothetical protein evm_008038 [Chilo suppressalis]|nr:hypothetical protein evm_008038 [Chilo suppressalis]